MSLFHRLDENLRRIELDQKHGRSQEDRNKLGGKKTDQKSVHGAEIGNRRNK